MMVQLGIELEAKSLPNNDMYSITLIRSEQ